MKWDRQSERKIDKQTETRTDKQTDRHTRDRYIEKKKLKVQGEKSESREPERDKERVEVKK